MLEIFQERGPIICRICFSFGNKLLTHLLNNNLLKIYSNNISVLITVVTYIDRYEVL